MSYTFKSWKSLKESNREPVNFIIDQWNHGFQKKCIEMYSKHNEGNLLLLKDLLEP